MALLLQEELEEQGIKLGPRGVDLGRLTTAALNAANNDIGESMNTIKPPKCPDCEQPVMKDGDVWYHVIPGGTPWSGIPDYDRPSAGEPDVQLDTDSYVRELLAILGHASEGTLDPERGEAIARRALAEACDNREGK